VLRHQISKPFARTCLRLLDRCVYWTSSHTRPNVNASCRTPSNASDDVAAPEPVAVNIQFRPWAPSNAPNTEHVVQYALCKLNNDSPEAIVSRHLPMQVVVIPITATIPTTCLCVQADRVRKVDGRPESMVSRSLWVADWSFLWPLSYPSFGSIWHSLLMLAPALFVAHGLENLRSPQALHNVRAPSGPRLHSGVSARLQL
jgi:hypothetical protein